MTEKKQNLTEFADWVLPRNIQTLFKNTIIYPVKRYLTIPSKDRQIISRNIIFKNCHKGARCFIIATGPSIKQQDLSPLRNEICIATSQFYLHPDYRLISPHYYCVAGFCENHIESFWDTWMDALDTQASPKTKFFFSLLDKTRCTRNNRFNNREIFFLENSDCISSLRKMGIDLTHPVPTPYSVPVMALEIALYMGFSEIYLIGCDHDWILHMYESRHFYDENQSLMHKYKIDEWCNDSFLMQSRQDVNLWEQYEYIKKIADKQQCKIYNATNGGLLDVFPRKQFESLFRQ